MPDLTTRRHLETRSDIERAAVALFTARGYDAVTMADIAGAAGVSRRTAYRHFPNKDELLYEHPRRWLECFDRTLAGRRSGESTREACRRALLAVAELIESERDSVLAAWTVIASHDNLRAHTARTQDTWVQRYVEVIGTDVGQDGALVVTTLAGALVAMTNALVVVWAAGQPDADMTALTAEALDYIDPLWPAPCR